MHKLLVVDDDKITHAFIKRALLGEFDLTPTFSGEEALEALANFLPEVILLDVEMPGLNGYEVCERIKSNPRTEDIPVIFLSARSDLRDRMQGFEAGADDYIVKPFLPQELLAKLNVLLQYRLRRKELASQVEEARKTAFIALSSASDLGQAIAFIERIHFLSTFDQLADAFFNVTQAMDLKCTLMIKSPSEPLFFSSSFSEVSPIEAELISNLSNEKRFFDFGCRTQINYPNISMLIKNMPLDDMERYGRIKDFFPAMLSSADIKIDQLCSQIGLHQQLEETRQAFNRISELLNSIKSDLTHSHKQGIKIMRAMLKELDHVLPRMALDEDQEQYILDRIDRAIDEAYLAISSTEETNKSFGAVLDNLNELLVKQQSLNDVLLAQNANDHQLGNDEGYEMDVELF